MVVGTAVGTTIVGTPGIMNTMIHVITITGGIGFVMVIITVMIITTIIIMIGMIIVDVAGRSAVVAAMVAVEAGAMAAVRHGTTTI